MKTGLIVPANLYFAPYIDIYTHILNDLNVDFDIIFWDRELINEAGGIAYISQPRIKFLKLDRLTGYLGFTSFVRKIIRKNGYDKLIIFTAQLGLFLYPFLKRSYSNNFILDYRDLSIDQRIKPLFSQLLKISKLRVISSQGFLKSLPEGFDYILSHNFNIEHLRSKYEPIINLKNNKTITVSTIGAIRDYEANREVIDALRDNLLFCLRFIGKGPSSEALQQYVKEKNIKNVFFQGYYEKEDEALLVRSADFMNIYYPRIIHHSSAMSNRFYNALINKTPMIVTSDSIQGDYVEKYNLGLSVKDCSNLSGDLKNFINNFDEQDFIENCDLLLSKFMDDYSIFRKAVISYIK